MAPNEENLTPSRKSDRAFGEAPSLGKVVRSPHSGIARKASSRRRRVSKDGGNTSSRKLSRSSSSRFSRDQTKGTQKKHFAWSILLFTGTLGVVITLTVMYFRNQRPAPAVNSYQITEISRTPDRLLTLEKDEAVEIARTALLNRDPTKVPKLFRLRADVTPADVIAKLEELEEAEGKITKTTATSPIFMNGLGMERVLVQSAKLDSKSPRLVYLIPDSAGNWKLDFAAYIREAQPSWTEILKGEPISATVRVFILRDNYYNTIYLDDEVWSAFRFTSPDFEGHLFGYAKINTPQHRALEKIFEASKRVYPLTLQIKRGEGADPRQVEITSVLADNWVMAETPYDAEFK